ncbi:MAG: winged helix-turn-helix domain-containing protein [Myxococcota bacterium]
MASGRFTVGSGSRGTREVDLERQVVKGPDGEVPLSPNEVGLLRVLAARPGEVVGRDELLVEGLGYRRAVHTRAIDQAIWRLRKKLEAEPSNPLHLRSEPNAGYSLQLEPQRDVGAFGRRPEADRLAALLAREGEVWVVGPPGIGRLTLARTAPGAQVVEGDAPAAGPGPVVRIGHRLPEGGAACLRLGPLGDEEARRLLVERVLAARGAAALDPAERDQVDAVVASAGGHPATLAAIADAATLAPLSAGPLPVPAPLRRWVADLPRSTLEAMAALAQFPDPLDAADAAAVVGEGGLDEVWRACGVEAMPGRRFVVLPAVRAVLREVLLPDEVVARYRAHVKAQALGAARRALEREDAAARDQLKAWMPRILGLWDEGDPELLLVAAARMLPVRPWLEALAPSDPDQAVARHMVLSDAWIYDWDDGTGEAHNAAAWEVVAQGGVGWALRSTLIRGTLNWALYTPRMAWLAEQAAALEAEAPNPVTRAGAAYARAMLALQRGQLAAARTELLESQRQYALCGADWLRTVAMSYLATVLRQDGRLDEAVRWQLEALEGDQERMELAFRASLAHTLLVAGDLPAFDQQLLLIDALVEGAIEVQGLAAWRAVRAGDLTTAVVAAQRCWSALPAGEEGWWWARVAEAWARMLRGEEDEAERLLWPDPPPEHEGPSVEAGFHGIDVGLARAAWAARQGDAPRAHALLDEIVRVREIEVPRWWPVAHAAVDVHAGGGGAEALRAEAQRLGVGSLSLAVAVDAAG